jgi:NAD(P)-dependent dehydrogenase (short-subunit alcohol dehydrogenase family)
MDAPFRGRIAIVTGAGRGLRRAVARGLRRLGATVILHRNGAEIYDWYNRSARVHT